MSELPPQQALLEENRRLQAQNQALESRINELEQIRRHLEHTLAIYKRYLFGSRSEKVDPQELEARVAQAAQEAKEQVAQHKRPEDPPPEAEEEQPETPTPEESAPEAPPPAPEGKGHKRQARPHGRGAFPPHLPRRRIEHPVDPAQATRPCCPDHPP